MSFPLDELRERLNSKPGAYEDMPFGADALVFKVDVRARLLARGPVDYQPQM